MRSLQQRRDRVRFRNSTERLTGTTNNSNLNVVNNENLRTGGREVLSQSAHISPQTPTSPQGQLLGEAGGQPLEEAREPVASRLEGLSLGQEGRHRIKVISWIYINKILMNLLFRSWSLETRRTCPVCQPTTFPLCVQASYSNWSNSANDRGPTPSPPPCLGRLPSTRGSGSCRRSWTA